MTDQDRLDSNTLGEATSPYLRQHADNPVHWQQWGDEALTSAARRDVPILLSVGYSSCHWCHVMAHESFEDSAVAAVMNQSFVCIKVDREERPDIDAVYMNATVAMTGQGGWPMTCFLTPSGDPFYCGTYFPPVRSASTPSFTEILHAITQAWTERRDEADEVGSRVSAHIVATSAGLPGSDRAIGPDLLAEAVEAIRRDEDVDHGGFGEPPEFPGPKFPPSAILEGLARHAERTSDSAVADTVMRTLSAMARGGIYDQLGGGFSRYAVDRRWQVPHFEKMLYDNAQLLRVYAHLARTTGDALCRRVTAEIIEFLRRDLSVTGGFASALDADTDGVEGLTYVWTPAQLVDVLGDDDGVWAAQVFGVTEQGTFENGTSTLTLAQDAGDTSRYSSVRRRLLAARAQRPSPGRDDKVVTAWNAMAITALAEAGGGLDDQEWVDLAARSADSLLAANVVDDEVRRSSRDGVAGDPPGMLDDHAALATAVLTLHAVTGERRWRDVGLDILDATVDRFADENREGVWFDAPASAQTPITRPSDPTDTATPSGASLMAEALMLGSLLAPLGRASRYEGLAQTTVQRAGVLLERAPRAAGHWLAVAEALVAGPIQVAVAEGEDSDGRVASAARRRAPGGAVVVSGRPDSLPLLAGRGPVAGSDAAYVCRGHTCDLPVTELAELDASLTR